jgi:uncharacterized damage-inducible protein DinB
MSRRPARAQGERSVQADAQGAGRLVQAWRTNNRATIYLIEHLPDEIWTRDVPGVRRFTVRMMAAHIHNSRCRWVKALGRGHGIDPPPLVSLHRVTRAQLVRALARSSERIAALIELGHERGGHVPRATWQNFPTDLPHFLAYFVAHEAHHRGQLILVARQLGHRLPREVAGGVWQWTRMSRETAQE